MAHGEPDPGRITFLLVGLFAGLVIGGAVVMRMRWELEVTQARSTSAEADAATLRAERDALRGELAEAGRQSEHLAAALREARAATRMPAGKVPDSPETAAKKRALLELLTAPSAEPAAP